LFFLSVGGTTSDVMIHTMLMRNLSRKHRMAYIS
jgi:hypothetical protein